MNQKQYCRRPDPKSPPPDILAADEKTNYALAAKHASEVVDAVLAKVQDDEEWDVVLAKLR